MKTLYILITSLIIFSCNQKDKIPKGVLEKDKMQAVLWDVLQADESKVPLVYKRPNQPQDKNLLKIKTIPLGIA